MLRLLGIVAIAASGYLMVVGKVIAGCDAFVAVIPCGPPTTAVPEPATLGLMAAGIGALAIAKFRKRRSRR